MTRNEIEAAARQALNGITPDVVVDRLSWDQQTLNLLLVDGRSSISIAIPGVETVLDAEVARRIDVARRQALKSFAKVAPA